MSEPSFSHINKDNQPAMVDVGAKKATSRLAKASATIFLGKKILEQLTGNKDAPDAIQSRAEIMSKKGPVFQTAIIAGVLAAKQTGNLIPLCHPIGMDNCQIEISVLDSQKVQVICTASVFAKTGIEMEALMGASIAALTIYDMCKALSHDIRIENVVLLEKRGGKKDFLRA